MLRPYDVSHALGLSDSESLSALKSNMGDREIVFFRLTDYLYFFAPFNREKLSPHTTEFAKNVPGLKKMVIASLWCNQI